MEVSTDVEAAAAKLRAGGLVAMPTETVYGLAADADNPAAVARIFEAKGRPTGHPLIIHLANGERLGDWVLDVAPGARVLAETCWPGPLTMLFRRSPRVRDVVTGGRESVGIRVPANPVATRLLEAFGGGVAAPSANRFGKVSPTAAQHVLDDLGDILDPARDAILDGGASPVGVESTIVDWTVDPAQLLRPGGIPASDIEAILGAPLAAAVGEARAGGMLPSHYAPTAVVHLVEHSDAATDLVALLVARERVPVVIDHRGDLPTFARELYADLRRADSVGATDIVAVAPPPVGLGHAVRDRLTRAAHRDP